MILTIDIGNSQVHGGVFDGDKDILQFRKRSIQQFSSDEIGIFLLNVLRENSIDPLSITDISLCSVVPSAIHSFRSGCIKYFKLDPFILKPGTKTGLKIKYRNPLEVGTDRIANAIAATKLYPGKNLIVIDFGTATTFCVISREKEYLGGVILPGIRISMEALEKNTAQLPTVEIKELDSVVGKSTAESIQSGLYYGQIGIVNEIKKRIINESFSNEKPVVIGTGGFSTLFEEAGLFDVKHTTLVLQGLYYALEMNKCKE